MIQVLMFKLGHTVKHLKSVPIGQLGRNRNIRSKIKSPESNRLIPRKHHVGPLLTNNHYF